MLEITLTPFTVQSVKSYGEPISSRLERGTSRLESAVAAFEVVELWRRENPHFRAIFSSSLLTFNLKDNPPNLCVYRQALQKRPSL